jgi:hypothetical protein
MMVERLKTFATVAVATLLIWVWAEAESVTTQEVRPRVEFVSAPDRSVTIVQPEWTGTVSVRLRGSTAGIDRAQRVLAAPIKLVGGSGGVPTDPGDYTVDLVPALRAYPELRRLGVSVDETEPASVRVKVQAIRTVTLPIKPQLLLPTGQAVELDGEPTLSPPTVTLRGPAGLLDQLGPTAATSAIVDADQLARLRDDAPQTVVAKVIPPESLGGAAAESVTIEPARVSIVLRLQSRNETWSLPSVPVWIAVPPTEGAKWSVELVDPFIKNVMVTGPKDLIRGLRQRGEVPVAYVELTSDDLEKRISSKRVVFSHLPSTLQFAANQTTVALRITPRQEATPVKEE